MAASREVSPVAECRVMAGWRPTRLESQANSPCRPNPAGGEGRLSGITMDLIHIALLCLSTSIELTFATSR
jgi:hypothetical protein